MRGLSLLLILGGIAVSPSLAQQAQPAGSTSTAGLVTKMSLDDLKAIYDGAGVAYEVRAFDDGKQYLSAAPEGYRMYAVLTGCPDPAKAVDCAVLLLESGQWDTKLTTDQLEAFNSAPFLGKAFLNEGYPAISYAFVLEPGVAPDYVRTSLRHFLNLMKYFGSFEWLPAEAAAAPTPAPNPAGTFAIPALSETDKSEAPQREVVPSR